MSCNALVMLWQRSGDALALQRRSGAALATLFPRSGDALSMLWRLAMLWQRSGHALTLERRYYTLPCALKLLNRKRASRSLTKTGFGGSWWIMVDLGWILGGS